MDKRKQNGGHSTKSKGVDKRKIRRNKVRIEQLDKAIDKSTVMKKLNNY
jgi:hypothetical protein